VTEAELQACVLDLAKVMHWRCAHFRPAQTSHGWRTPVAADGKGFPDLVLCKPGRLLFVELKAHGARLSHEQQEWVWALSAVGLMNVHVWRPADWESGEILRTLSGGAA
jgi:hypothetical protein